jgi:lysophospholipase L1-like esterase
MLKVILVLSILFNLLALWGFFTYIRYGGSPLGELKRKLTGTTKQSGPKIPFEEEYARIRQEIAEGKLDSLRVVFFGASITARWDLQEAFPDIHPINRGVGGQLIYNMMPRFKRDVLDLQPKAVVIKFCSINIRPHVPLQHLKDGMTMLCQLSRANGITPVVATIIPAGKPEARIGDFSVVDTLRAFNEWARQYAAQQNLPILDFAKAIEDDQGFLPRECSVDPVHLNEKGYEIVRAAARPVLQRVVETAPK